MNSETTLFRQIHPNFLKAGRVTSQAFKPTPKDNEKLSVYDGDQIAPQKSWEHYTSILQLASSGVLAVTVEECSQSSLDVIPDPQPFPEHVLIDFTGKTTGQKEKAAKKLRKAAVDRGWQYLASS